MKLPSRIVPFIVALGLCYATANAQGAEWFLRIREIKILEATSVNVVSLLGQPEESTYPYYRSHRLKEAAIHVEYSSGLCEGRTTDGWNVPELTVTRIFVAPSKDTTPRKLGISLARFEKHKISDSLGAFSFENESDGINVTLNSTGKIESISLYPTKQQLSLHCSRLVRR
jgi:hypothetical protein